MQRRRTEKNSTEEISDRLTGKYTKKLAILPSLLRVLSKDNQDNYEKTKPLDTITQYQFKRDWIADLTSKIKTSNRGLEQKASPIIFLKEPNGILDFYSKAKEAKKSQNHKNAIGYIERNTIPTDYHHYQSKMNMSKEKTKNSKSALKVRQIFYDKPVGIETNTTQSQDAIQHSKGCCCSKTLPELIKKLIKNIEKLITSKVLCSKLQSMEEKHKPCCHKKATGTLFVTTQDPSDYLESNQLAKALTLTTEAKAANMSKIKDDVENLQNLGRNDQTFRNDHTNQSEATNSSTASQLKDKLFEEYFDYIAKRNSSTTTEVTTTTHAETTSIPVANFVVQIEDEANNVETTTKRDDKQYVYISKIYNPKLKTTTTPTTIGSIEKSFLITEEIKPPNQSNENYNQFLKVLQEYEELNDDVKIFLEKTVNSDALDMPETPTNNNDSISELNHKGNNKTLNLEHSSAELSDVPVMLPTTKNKMIKIFETDYIKVVNGKRKLHSSEKRHNPQYLALVSNDPNNDIVTKEFTTTIPDSAKTITPFQVFQINHNSKVMEKVPFGIRNKEPEFTTEKQDITIEDLEIDDQMQLDDNINSNEEQRAKKKHNHRFGDMLSEYNMPYTVSKLSSGRPSYLEISNRNDWSPHFDDEAFNT